MEEALKPGAVEIHPGGNLSLNNQRQRQPQTYKRGNVADGLQAADRVFEDNFTTAHHNNAQLEMRVSVAEWTGRQADRPCRDPGDRELPHGYRQGSQDLRG